jgi:hypothetical protein
LLCSFFAWLLTNAQLLCVFHLPFCIRVIHN